MISSRNPFSVYRAQAYWNCREWVEGEMSRKPAMADSTWRPRISQASARHRRRTLLLSSMYLSQEESAEVQSALGALRTFAAHRQRLKCVSETSVRQPSIR